MNDKLDGPATEPAPPQTTQAPVPGCPLCDTWKQWVAARMQEQGGFEKKPIAPAELHDLLMVGYALYPTIDDVTKICDHHRRSTDAIEDAIEKNHTHTASYDGGMS